jgi:hypothetical protein
MAKLTKKKMLLTATIAVAATFFALRGFQPLRRSDEGVRAWVLRKTPVGLSSEEIRPVARKQGWTISDDYKERGGRRTIRGELGRYLSVPFYTYVTVFWTFDDSNRVMDVRIWKTVDGL